MTAPRGFLSAWARESGRMVWWVVVALWAAACAAAVAVVAAFLLASYLGEDANILAGLVLVLGAGAGLAVGFAVAVLVVRHGTRNDRAVR